MADARNLLRTLAYKDRRGAVFCAALAAASVAHLVPVGERRPWRAVRLALAWGMGVEVSRERMRAAATAAADAYDDGIAAAPAAAAAGATEAVASAAPAYAAESAAEAFDDAVDAARPANADPAESVEASRNVYAAYLAFLHALVLHQITPIAPTPTDVHRATPGAQVAWDRLVERCPDPVRIGTLGDALSRARKGRLRWTCPVERAIAERTEGAELVAIVRGG